MNKYKVIKWNFKEFKLPTNLFLFEFRLHDGLFEIVKIEIKFKILI